MIKSLIAYLLIFTLLGSNSTRFLVYASFKLNQNYIASVLCENRSKPVLQCKGKCYLTKKLKQADEKEKSQERDSQKNRFFEALIQDKAKTNFDLQLLYVINTAVLQQKLTTYTASVFHPPQKPTSLS